MDEGMYRPSGSWRNGPPVRERDRRVSRSLWIVLIGLLALSLPILFYLDQKGRYTETGYRLVDVHRAIDRAGEVERHVRVEVAAMESLPRVEDATAGLGLEKPLPETVVVVRTTRPVPDDRLARAPDARGPEAR